VKLTSHTDFGLRIWSTFAAAHEPRFTIEELAQRRCLCRFTQALRHSLESFLADLAELDKITLAELAAPRRFLRARASLDPTMSNRGTRSDLDKLSGR